MKPSVFLKVSRMPPHEPETKEPVAPVSTDLAVLDDAPETNEPAAPVTSDPTDPQSEPESEELLAPVPLAPPSPFLHLHVHPAHLNIDPDDSAG